VTTLKPLAILIVALISTGFAACATNDSEAAAKLEVNEDGEYIFEDNDDYRDEIVCKRRRVSGSHVPLRVCKTRAQMEEEQAEVLESVGPLAPMAGDELQRLH